MKVDRPRLRRRGGGAGAEVPVPAYDAMKSDNSLGEQVFNVMMRGVSTRSYEEILSDACDCAGVSKSSVSREFVEASEHACKELLERKFDVLDLPVLYRDCIVMAGHNVLVAIGVDSDGYKHVLGLKKGASENAAVVAALLTDLVERGVKPGVKRLFVIEGSKALSSGIDSVFGSDNPIQRCRLHKERSVLDCLPDEQKECARLSLRAAGSIREGLSEMFPVNRLGVPASLRRSLVSTNLIESSNAGICMRTRRVTEWDGGKMVLRWVAANLISAEKKFRRISGCKDLWMLSAELERKEDKNRATQEGNAVIAA